MDDNLIIELYWQRNQLAVSETEIKYGPYCRSIAYGTVSYTHLKKMGLSQTLAFEPKTLGISRPLLRLQTCMNSPQLAAASWGVFAIDPNTCLLYTSRCV